jgi:hypothetical protein
MTTDESMMQRVGVNSAVSERDENIIQREHDAVGR